MSSSASLSTPKGAAVYDVAGSSITSTSTDQKKKLTVAERCLLWLSVLATIYSLYAARSILVPITIALVAALLLRPVVEHVTQFVPRGIAALAALLLVVTTFALIVIPVYNQIDELGLTDTAQIRGYADEVKERFEPVLSWYENMRASTEELDASAVEVANAETEPTFREQAAELISGKSEEPKEPPVQKVVEEQKPLIDTALGAGFSFVSSTLLVVILLYFLLAAGDDLIANVIAVTPGVQEKKRMAQLVKKVERGVSTYLFTIAGINAGLGVAVGIAMWLLGMPAPWLFGFMAFLFNFVPFVGAIVGMAIAAVVAVIVFPAGTEGVFGLSGQVMWGLVPGTYFLLTNLEGNLVTPTLIGQRMSLNPVLVFVSLVFWGWIWGIGGALLAVPMLAVLRIWFGHFEATRGLAAVLGD